MLRIIQPESNCVESATIILQILNVKVTKNTLNKDLEEHPNYPSLLSISDVFNDYGVENLTLSFADEKMFNSPVPFITQIKGIKVNADYFTVVKEIKGDGVTFYDPERHTWSYCNFQTFLQRCSGIALLVELTETAGEKDYTKRRKIELQQSSFKVLSMLLMPILLLLSSTFYVTGNHPISFSIILNSVLTLSGWLISFLLLWFELDKSSPMLQQICGASKKTNCSAVIEGKGSKIAGISWSSIGFSYFTGSLLLILFNGLSNPVVTLYLYWLNLIAASYIFFSIYYQWRVVKQWCTLCLIIQAILALQFINVLFDSKTLVLDYKNMLIANSVVSVLTAYLLPFFIVNTLMPVLLRAKEDRLSKLSYRRLKLNPNVFNALLLNQKSITKTPEIGIRLGNPNASTKIVKVCSPYCGPCAKAHKVLEALLQNNPNIEVQIVFMSTNSEKDERKKPVSHLLAIAENEDEAYTSQALDDWYNARIKDYNAFKVKHSKDKYLTSQNEKIEVMKDWCDMNEIRFTPTFFIANNATRGEFYQMPETLTVMDLKYILLNNQHI